MRKFLIITFTLVLIVSCQKNKNSSISNDKAGYVEGKTQRNMNYKKASNKSTIKIEKQTNQTKKIIKDGRINLSVTQLEKSKSRIDGLVEKYNAYYAKEKLYNNNRASTYDLKIRIPSKNFEALISEIIEGDGKIQYKEIKTRDVTADFIDIETRLDNKKKYLERYKILLKRAKNIKEILAIESKIRPLEEEIESTKGRLKYLNDLVDFSTLELKITKHKSYKYIPEKRAKFIERFKQSISRGWYGFIDFFLFAIGFWPFWIAIFLIIFFWRKIKLKRNAKK